VAEIPIPASRVKAEMAALDRAVAETVTELTELRDSALKKMGGPVAKIFDAQLLIAGDFQFLNQVKEEIAARRRNAGFIYNSLVQQNTMPLRRSPEPYLRMMSQDIEAVANRVLSRLGGYRETPSARLSPGTILVGKSFAPGEIVNYRKLKATGLLVGEGGRNSHAALIARSLMLPMVVAEAGWTRVANGCRLILDGTAGVVIVNPSDQEWADYQKRRKQQGPALASRIRYLTQVPPMTADGRAIEVAANLELPGPVEDVLATKKIPIGLYRTEFIYLQSERFPSEEEQFEYYDRIARQFSDTSVVLRTFDLGSDKFKGGSPEYAEDNPALGFRGIRSMLVMSDVFKTQLRAILRASTRKNLKILLPMISDAAEVDRAGRLLSQAMLELRRKDIPFDNDIEIGIMVEVPSAALMADQLSRKVDFISIGTNDLTQYTLSADRNNDRVAGLYSPLHPSVLHLIKMIVDACKRSRIPVAICGEAAGDPLALPLFIGLGVEQLSMNPARIVDLCRLVKKIDSSLVSRLVDSVLASNSQASVTRKLQSFKNAIEKK
jgi:phosphotransferase system enzyme I (PtsI)